LIIFKFKENRNIPIQAIKYVLGYRWIFEINYFCIGFAHQCQSTSDGKWNLAGSYYYIDINRFWRFGRTHAYYDGPHDGFSIGFIHFNWSGNWCDKCCDPLQ